MAPVPYSATLRERLDDAEARAAAYAQLIREKDATITRLGQDLRVRTKKLGEAVAALEPLQAEICALKVEVERLRRRVKL